MRRCHAKTARVWPAPIFQSAFAAMPSLPLSIGHRGAAGTMPENTMPPFEHALSLGADAIEFDVALTRDGAPVVIHDDSVDRTTDGRGRVADLDLAQIRALEAGLWKGVPARVPTLDEVLAEFGPRTTLNLEIKRSRRRDELVEACARAVQERELLGRVVFSSFDHEALRVLRYQVPTARIGVLCELTRVEAAFRCAHELGAENLHPPALLVTANLLRRARERGLAVWTWTINDPRRMARFCALGVDGIFSDFPDRVSITRGDHR